MTTTRLAPADGDLATRVTRRRTALGLSRAEVAGRAGLDLAQVIRVETVPVALTAGELGRLADALDSTILGLVGAPDVRVPQRQAPVHPVLDGMRRQECVRLLESGGIGRIAYRLDGQLVVVPLNFCWSGDAIVIRTTADGAIARCTAEPVAFEVDRLEPGLQQGWSVLVNGSARPATVAETAAARDRVRPWVGGDRAVHIVIEPVEISGRRIRTW